MSERETGLVWYDMRGFWKSLALFQMNRASVKSRTSCRRATVNTQCTGRMGSGGDPFQMYHAGIKASTGQRDLTWQEVCNTMDHEVDNLKCLKRETNPGPCAEMRLNEKSVCNTQDPGKTTSNVSSGNLNPGPGTTVYVQWEFSVQYAGPRGRLPQISQAGKQIQDLVLRWGTAVYVQWEVSLQYEGPRGRLPQMSQAGNKSRTLCWGEALQCMYNEKSVCKTKDHGEDYPKCLKRESNPGPCAEVRHYSVCTILDQYN